MRLILLIFLCLLHQALFAQPHLNSFSPASGAVGTTVTITGTGFSGVAENNAVFFGAVRATVTAASPTSLSVTVPPGASYKFITVTVGGLMANSKKPFLVTFPGAGTISASSFADPVIFNSNLINTSDLAAKDLDNDGKADLVSSTVLIHKNNSTAGSPAFAPPQDFNNNDGARLAYVSAEDLNGDTYPDIVSFDKIIKNTSTPGALSFAAPAGFAAGGPTAIIDVDGDGLPEIARARPGSSFATIYRNISSGGNISFQSYGSPIGGTSTSTGVEAVYINNDDKPDMISSTGESDNFIRIYINNSTPGNIAFTQDLYLFLPMEEAHGIKSIAVGDFDGDDKTDVAASWQNGSTGEGIISIFKNTTSSGSATFAVRVDYSVGNTIPFNLSISDFDGDGKPDLLAALGQSPNVIAILRNISAPGTISFAPKIEVSSPFSPLGHSPVELTDVDNDGKPDICIGDYYTSSIAVLRNINGTTLPIILQSFNAQWKGNDTELKWATQSEQNVKHFIIERSIDNASYVELGTVSGRGNSNTVQQYNFIDADAKTSTGKNFYYRLKTVNTDGSITYSVVAVLGINASSLQLVNIAPNPFKNSLRLFITSPKKVTAIIHVIDASGKILIRKSALLDKGSNTLSINSSQLIKGWYSLQLAAEGVTMSFSILKQ